MSTNQRTAPTTNPELVVALHAEATRMEHELTALAAETERWWTAPAAAPSPTDLAEGERLHRAIEARLYLLDAIRQAVADAVTATP